MRFVQSQHPFGTVIVPTSGAPRFLNFYTGLGNLEAPEGTKLTYGISSDITAGLNYAFEELQGAWVFIVGDDHIFSPKLLMKLLDYNLPAVASLNIQRGIPFFPVVMDGPPPAGKMIAWDEVPVGADLWYPKLRHIPSNSGLLVRREVLDNMEKPYFRAGTYQSGAMNEDIYFVEAVKRVSGNIPIQCALPLGHMLNMTAIPTYLDGQWGVEFRDYKHNPIWVMPGPTPPTPVAPCEDRVAGGAI